MFESEQQAVETKIREFCANHDLPDPSLQWSSIPFSGQWGICTSFFQLAAQEARQGKKINVPQRAAELAELVQGYIGLPAGFERTEAIKGYLNLFFSSAEYARRVIDSAIAQEACFGSGESKGQRVMVEFSQPNTHKSIHVGHLRNMILGAAVANILEFAGYEVIRTTYPGDIGLHVIKWMWNYQKRHMGEQPASDKLRWMQELYSEADRYYTSEPNADQEVRALFARWDKRDPEVVQLWNTSREWSMEGFYQFSDLMGVHFDRVYYESEVEEPGKHLVQELIERGIANDERPDGAVVI
ncbi:MAG: arginine--tRNA ligase, partial [Anaerolineaceae bacterium]|nr:arginine--tRNA ligase [Anaerolineaceae bacterium]